MSPSLADVKQSNASLNMTAPVAVVVGGTSGIGSGIAAKLAQYSTTPTIHLVGRSESSSAEVIARLRQINGSGTYEFHQCDVSLLAQVRALCKTLLERHSSISHLILSAGVIHFSRQATSEGNELGFTLAYYSRMLFIQELLPALPGAKVVSVLNSVVGHPKHLDWDDLELRKNYGFLRGFRHGTTMTDIAFQYLADQHPETSFIHLFPGHVKSNIGRTFPFYISFLAWLLALFIGRQIEPQDAAEFFVSGMQRHESNDRPFYMNAKGESVKDKVLVSKQQALELWTHTESVINRV